MAYTVTQLIVESYYLSGRVSQGLQTITGPQLNAGLRYLNALLAVKSVNSRLIPYYNEYQFNAVVGQEEYFIPGLIYVETLTFLYSTVRWSMIQCTRKDFQGSSRAENIKSIMQNYYVERCKGGANLFMYFFPDQTYPMKIWGKFALLNVVLNQDLEATLEDFYIEYLRYALAEYICQANNITFQPQNKATLDDFEQQFLDIDAPDLTVQRKTAYGSRPLWSWSLVNLSHGWQPY